MANIAADVLCECFALLPFADRVIATHVCRHWRQSSLSRPGALWSHIISNGFRTGVVRQLFERAQNVPVDVEILLTDETFKDAMATVSDHLSHIRQLRLHSLELGEGELFVTNIHPVYRALAYPAPILEELEIALRIDDRSLDDFDLDSEDDLLCMRMVLNFDYRIPTNLFAAHAPCLRKAAFRAMQLHPDGVPALTGLTRLKYTGSTLPASQLSAIVCTLPNLRALCIEAQTQHGYELPDTPLPAEFALDELDVDMILSDQPLGPLLLYLKYQQIRDVTTYRFDNVGWLDVLVAPPRSIPSTLHLYDVHTNCCNWHMVDANGYASRGRAFQVAALFDALLTRNIFSRVETLVLSATLLSLDIPPLEQLTHLSLCFSRSSEMSVTPRARPLLCPILRVLEICGRAPGLRPPFMSGAGKVDIYAGNLERFLDNAFSFPPHRLPRIVLRNVLLDVSELLQCQSIFGTLSTAEEPLTVPAALDPKGRHRKWHVCHIDE